MNKLKWIDLLSTAAVWILGFFMFTFIMGSFDWAWKEKDLAARAFYCFLAFFGSGTIIAVRKIG